MRAEPSSSSAASSEALHDTPPNTPSSPVPWLGTGGLRAFLNERYRAWATRRRWRELRALGLRIGADVNLPASVWIDTSHCHLISIGDHCGFGDGVCILAHDALANEFLDATRIAPVVIHPSCHIGARAVILPGVEIGPRAIVGANSVVTRSVPPDSVAAGNPARVLCTLEEHLSRLRRRLERSPRFPYSAADVRSMSPAAREAMWVALGGGDGFVVGGYSRRDERAGRRVTPRT